MTDQGRWPEIKVIVQGALDLSPEERATYLDKLCGDDDELRQEVEAFLAISSTEADFFDNYTVVPPSMETLTLKEGDELGPYRIVREIGKGGMGAVYLADDREHGRNVALKTVPRHSQRALLHEKRLLASLRHPNIAILFDSGQTKTGLGYFIMEYVEGEPITSYCDRLKLTIRQRLELFLSVCDAVAYAHRNLVVHRDLKPKNILVTADGEVKLLDFGIAKLLPSEPVLVPAEARSFTVAFASPEQLEGERTTTATDIYSLGVLLCLLLTGRLPYPVKSAADLPWAIRNLVPEKPSLLVLKEDGALNADGLPVSSLDTAPQRVARKLRGDIDAIVLRALQKDADLRNESVQSLADDIRRLLSNRPVSARHGSRWYYAQKFWERHKVALPIAILTFIVLAGLSVALLMQYREAVRQRNRALQEAARSQEVTNFLVTLFEGSDPWDPDPATLSVPQLLTRAYDRASSGLTSEPDLQATIQATLGNIFSNLGDLDRAEKLLTASLRTLQTGADTGPKVEGMIWYNLGALRYHQGNFSTAIEAHQKALLVQLTINPANHYDTATTLAALGQAVEAAGDPEAARKHYEKSLREAELLSGATRDLTRADTLTRLAALERKASNYADAERYCREALSLLRKRLRSQHPRTALTLNNLGVILSNAERYPDAEAAYLQAINIYTTTLGPMHPEILKTRNSLGELYRKQGRLSEARRTHQDVLTTRRKVLTQDHPDIASSLNNLAAVLLETGPLAEAEALLRESLELQRKRSGGKPSGVEIGVANLGAALLLQERYAEAEELLSDGARKVEVVYGREHRDYILCQGNRAQALIYLGRTEEAEKVVREILILAQRVYGEDHTRVAILRGTLARIRLKQGRVDEAEQIARTSVAKLTNDLGEDNPSTIKARTLLAEILIESKRSDEARDHLLSVSSYWSQRAGKRSPSLLEVANLLKRIP